MIYSSFHDMALSLLGFGAMRLPTDKNGQIDEKETFLMVDEAISQGINYFDTAYPYHGGMSEIVLGRALARYKRDSFYLATKFPGHQTAAAYAPAAVFTHQLEKCGVDYFDFYLLHNVYEQSMDVYTDPKWGIIDYFSEQKRLGKIRHLGFSTHGSVETIKAFLDKAGEQMDFCQIQLNYLDWTLQDAKAKYELLCERNIPVWVMEPVRGGKLASLSPENLAKLKAHRENASPVEWCFRFLESLPHVKVILSGMSSMTQLNDNLRTFSAPAPLSEKELATLLDVAESLKDTVPCTACGYCKEGCPMGLHIPQMIATLNDIRFAPTVNPCMWIQALPKEKQPSACINCGACRHICPQKINVPEVLASLAEALKTIPSWAEICKEREEAQKKLQTKYT